MTKPKKTADWTLSTEDGVPLLVGHRNLILSTLKHDCPDGVYRVKGPGYAAVTARDGGIVYPLSGHMGGAPITPRSLAEAKEAFALIPRKPASPKGSRFGRELLAGA